MYLYRLQIFICPDGGPQDEGIARDAYISAIEETPELAEIKFEDLTSDQFMIIVERTMANVICNRITNDIANKIIALPQDQNTTKSLISQIKDFVKGAVSDSVSHLNIKAGNLPQGDTLKIVDQVYKTSFDIMVSVGEKLMNRYKLRANYDIENIDSQKMDGTVIVDVPMLSNGELNYGFKPR